MHISKSLKRLLNIFLVAVLFHLVACKTKAQSSLLVYDLKDSAHVFQGDRIVVIANLPTCMQCFRQLNEYFEADTSLVFDLVIHDTSKALNRKMDRQALYSFFPSKPPAYYTSKQHQVPVDSFLRQERKFYYTPAVLIIRGGQFHYIPYQQLFIREALNREPLDRFLRHQR